MSTWDTTLKNCSIALFFVVLAACSLKLTLTLEQQMVNTTNAVNQQLSQTRSDVLSRVDYFGNQSLNRIDKTSDKLFLTVDKTSSQVFKRLASLETNTFSEIREFRTLTEKNLMAVNNNTTKITDNIVDLTKSYKKVPDLLLSTAKAFENNLNCDVNDLCWPNLSQDVLLDTRNAMRAFHKNVPLLTSNLVNTSTIIATQTPMITTNITDITANINRMTKPKWYDRAVSWGVSGSLIYLNLKR